MCLLKSQIFSGSGSLCGLSFSLAQIYNKKKGIYAAQTDEQWSCLEDHKCNVILFFTFDLSKVIYNIFFNVTTY